jgi:hypothetical protein
VPGWKEMIFIFLALLASSILADFISIFIAALEAL